MNEIQPGDALNLSREAIETYQRAMQVLKSAAVPFLVGGAFSLFYYAGISRNTKDLDLFVRPTDRDRVLQLLAEADFSTRIRFPYWLAKAVRQQHSVDIIYRTPDGIAEVNDSWLARSVESKVLGIPVRLCPPEEVVWNKAYILNNDRNDLADVMHLFYDSSDRLDWDRLLELFGEHWRVLLAHLVLFGFVYPSERQRIPRAVLQKLMDKLRLEQGQTPPAEPVCNGTLFSHSQYNFDVQRLGMHDGRLKPVGNMTPQDVFDSTISLDAPLRQQQPEA